MVLADMFTGLGPQAAAPCGSFPLPPYPVLVDTVASCRSTSWLRLTPCFVWPPRWPSVLQDYYDSSDGLVLPATPEGHDEPASRLSFEAPGSAAAAAPAAAAAAAPCPPPPMAGARAVAAEAITPGEAPAPADAAARLPLFPATAPAAAAVAAAPAPAPPSAAAAAVGPGVGERGPVFSQDAHGGLAALASCELDLRPHTGKAHRLLAEGVDAGATAALGVASLAAGSGAGPGLAPAPSVTTLARDLQGEAGGPWLAWRAFVAVPPALVAGRAG